MMIALLAVTMVSQFSVGTMDTYGEVSEFCLSDGVIYASVKPDEMEDGASGSLMALDPASGRPIWIRQALDDGSSYFEPWNLVVADGKLYAIADSHCLLCRWAESGDTVFLREGGDSMITPFILDGEVIFVASKIDITALDSGTGELLWVFTDDAGEIGMYPTIVDVALHDGKLFAGAIIPSIRCFDAETGEFIWESQEVMDSGGAGYAHIHFVSDDYLFVSTASGELSILDVQTGQAVKYIENCDYLAGDGNGLFVYSWDDNYLMEIDPSTCQLMGGITPPFEFWGLDAAIENSCICISTGDGRVLLLERTEDGAIVEIFSDRLSEERMQTKSGNGWLTSISEDGILFAYETGSGRIVTGETGYLPGTGVAADGMGNLYFASGSDMVIITPD